METPHPPLRAPPRPRDPQDRRPKALALVPRALEAVRRCRVPPDGADPHHNPRFSAGGVGPSREAGRKVLVPPAVHHGVRAVVGGYEGADGAVRAVLEAVEEVAARGLHAEAE